MLKRLCALLAFVFAVQAPGFCQQSEELPDAPAPASAAPATSVEQKRKTLTEVYSQSVMPEKFDETSCPSGPEMNGYIRRVHQIVYGNWESLVPELARSFNLARATVKVQFRILRDGSIEEIEITEPSRIKSLDRAAWGAVKTSAPLPPLPAECRRPYLAMKTAFQYNPDTPRRTQKRDKRGQSQP